jgi:hypothetical protein
MRGDLIILSCDSMRNHHYRDQNVGLCTPSIYDESHDETIKSIDSRLWVDVYAPRQYFDLLSPEVGLTCYFQLFTLGLHIPNYLYLLILGCLFLLENQ